MTHEHFTINIVWKLCKLIRNITQNCTYCHHIRTSFEHYHHYTFIILIKLLSLPTDSVHTIFLSLFSTNIAATAIYCPPIFEVFWSSKHLKTWRLVSKWGCRGWCLGRYKKNALFVHLGMLGPPRGGGFTIIQLLKSIFFLFWGWVSKNWNYKVHFFDTLGVGVWKLKK